MEYKHRMVLVVIFFHIFEIIFFFFCLVVAIFDLLHYVEATHRLC